MTAMRGRVKATAGANRQGLPRHILHIGLHKTGTSSLQAYLSARRLSLLEHGIDFPLAGRTPRGSQAHRYVVALFRRQKMEYPPEFDQLVPGGLTDAEVRILSSEDFYFCSQAHIDEIARRLGSEVTVICYLREPVGHLLSMYKEHLKRAVGDSLPAFVNGYLAAMGGGAKFSYYSYSHNLSAWRRHFRLIAAPYRRDGLVADFMARCGLSLCDAPGDAELRENIALPDEAVMLQLAVNRAHLDGLIGEEEWSILRRKIVAFAARGDLPDVGSHRRATAVDMRPFLAAFREANPALAGLAEEAPEAIDFWDSETIDHEALLSIARAHMGDGPG